MSNNAKDLRKQIRNVLQDKEVMNSLLSDEVIGIIEKRIEAKLKLIEDSVKKVMTEMTERQKDTLGYLVRTATGANNPEVK